ncbi:MAG: diadenylate cyclase CdaA [Candidatus Eremiobacteraeota bacterium]|nr:diadenylate cyclase CdaA [Candidatus Eremiobacteraeota bacterium]
MSFIKFLLSQVTIKDIFDVLIVATFLYFFFSLIKGTRAVQIIQGVGVLLFILLVSYLFKLETAYWLFRYSLLTIAIAIPIVFQPELRRALGAIGRGGVFPSGIQTMDKETISRIVDELSWTVSVLSQAKIGALIVMERETGLAEFVETGTQVNGVVSSKLLLSIFMPKSPLHDGAVILRSNKVIAASCYLPLSENVTPSRDSQMGTRHRAALGITEQTDAVVILVSEETGAISVARNGKFTKQMGEETLKKILVSIYTTDSSKQNRFSRIGGKDVIKLFKKKSGT